jgi:hypothetical protein
MCSSEVLAVQQGIGSVTLCASCRQIHLTVGPISMRLEVTAYKQLTDMMCRAATGLAEAEARAVPGTAVLPKEQTIQ